MSETPAPMGEDTGTPDVEQTEGQQETKTDDYQSRIDSRLEEMSRTIQELAQRPVYEPQAEEDDEDPYPLEEGEDGFDEQEAQRFLQELVDKQVAERLQPLQQQQANEKRDQAYDKLKQDFPEFENEDVARKYIGLAVSDLEDLNPAAIEDHRLVKWAEKLYKADKADERAAQETPPQRTTSLESSGGAAPSENDGEDLQDRLIRAYQQSHTQI
jgi:hypothetical protein